MGIDSFHISAQNYNQKSVDVNLAKYVDKDKLQELVKYLNFSYNAAIRNDFKPFEATLSNKNILYLIHCSNNCLQSGQNLSEVADRLYSLTKNLFSNPNIEVDIQPTKGSKAWTAILAKRYGDNIVLSPEFKKNLFERIIPKPEVDKNPPIFSIYVQSDDEKTQFHRLLEKDQLSLNSHLIAGGVDCGTYLHFKIVNERYEEVRYLFSNYSSLINLSAVDKEGKTILITANKACAPSDVIKLILASKNAELDINARDSQGATALHYACLYGRLDLVKELIDKGAGKNIEDNEGRTPLDWARQDRMFIKHQLETISIDGERDVYAAKNFLRHVSLGFHYPILICKSNLDKMIGTIEKDPQHIDYKHLKMLKQLCDNLLGKSLIEQCEEGQKDVINYLRS